MEGCSSPLSHAVRPSAPYFPSEGSHLHETFLVTFRTLHALHVPTSKTQQEQVLCLSMQELGAVTNLELNAVLHIIVELLHHPVC